MKPIIEIRGLGKEYRLGDRQANYTTLREKLVHLARASSSFRRRSESETVWALRDVEFDVMPGEVVGVIGRNGAGKSTLLKILSRITEPTCGTVDLHGRVGSLLEVGTGFHPELTGRENIFLNGAILGMRRAEIERKFDEIVAFAEVERFLDTPVKRYSSGMYMRLAFAVPAHLEPEILVVDEVLSVGDAAFQKKCLGKMGEVAKDGRTVLFVSHNMAAVEALCTRAVLLQQGELTAVGEPTALISQYMTFSMEESQGSRTLRTHAGRVKNSHPLMTEVEICSEAGIPTASIPMNAPLTVAVSFSAGDEPIRPLCGIRFKTAQGVPVFAVSNRYIDDDRLCEPMGEGSVRWRFDHLPLMPGTYLLDLYFSDQGDVSHDRDVIHEAIALEVLPADIYGTGKLPHPTSGTVYWPAEWSVVGA